MDTDKFNYVYSCDLDINVQLKMWVCLWTLVIVLIAECRVPAHHYSSLKHRSYYASKLCNLLIWF